MQGQFDDQHAALIRCTFEKPLDRLNAFFMNDVVKNAQPQNKVVLAGFETRNGIFHAAGFEAGLQLRMGLCERAANRNVLIKVIDPMNACATLR